MRCSHKATVGLPSIPTKSTNKPQQAALALQPFHGPCVICGGPLAVNSRMLGEGGHSSPISRVHENHVYSNSHHTCDISIHDGLAQYSEYIYIYTHIYIYTYIYTSVDVLIYPYSPFKGSLTAAPTVLQENHFQSLHITTKEATNEDLLLATRTLQNPFQHPKP